MRLPLIGQTKIVALFSLTAVLLFASGFALSNYPGDPAVFLLFDVVFLVVILSAIPRPRQYVYTFFSAILFLGFWSKLMLHLAFATDLIEPIGNFTGSREEWDRALLFASSGGLGVAIARGVFLFCARKYPYPDLTPAFSVAPRWYVRLRKPIWLVSVLALLALNLLNFYVAFYQTGVNPKLILPAHLNVLPAWLLNFGFALWISILVCWDFSWRPNSLSNRLSAPIAEALVSSVSALSRSFYILHTLPYFLVVAENWQTMRFVLRKRMLIILLSLWVAFFAVSLTVVSWLRISMYRIEMPQQAAISQAEIRGMAHQVSSLFFSRWIGLEGVLAVSAYPDLGAGLLVNALQEDPALGNRSIYQRVSKSPFKQSELFTFLTVPGTIGVLSYSGSYTIIALGALLVALMMIGVEAMTSARIGNPFMLSVAGFAMANVVTQLNFPYLAMIFFGQLIIALIFVYILQGSRMNR